MVLKVILLIAIVLIGSSFGHSINYLPCSNGWVTYNGSPSCYNVPVRPTNSWYVARKNCISMGGDLVTISSTKENTFVGLLAYTYFPHHTSIWIGFITESNRQFTWVDGTPLKAKRFLNWNTGEPNNAHKQDEDCGSMVMTKNKLMKWNDLRCLEPSITIGYVCERERQLLSKGQ